MRILIIIVIFLVCPGTFAQQKVNYGTADGAVAELSEYEYYRGKWDILMEKKLQDNSFKKLKFKGIIEAKFLLDQRTFQTQFIGDNGFFSTDLRTFNVKNNQWEILFLNSSKQRWHKFSAKLVNGKMTTLVKGGYDGVSPHDIELVDTIISETKYIRNVYHLLHSNSNRKHVYKMTLEKRIE